MKQIYIHKKETRFDLMKIYLSRASTYIRSFFTSNKRKESENLNQFMSDIVGLDNKYKKKYANKKGKIPTTTKLRHTYIAAQGKQIPL